jgi:zinc transporter ZupT
VPTLLLLPLVQGEQAGGGHGGIISSRAPPGVVEIMEGDHHSFMLKKMGLLTGLAIFIHNFPEGAVGWARGGWQTWARVCLWRSCY